MRDAKHYEEGPIPWWFCLIAGLLLLNAAALVVGCIGGIGTDATEGWECRGDSSYSCRRNYLPRRTYCKQWPACVGTAPFPGWWVGCHIGVTLSTPVRKVRE